MASKLKVIPLGGLHEIGKNMTVYEYGGDILIVDAGVAFPDDEMFGIDLVIPDINYLIQHKNKVRGIVITHGHEDHIGAIPYVMRELNCPVFCTRLTAGIIEIRLQEHKMLEKVKINRIDPGKSFKCGCFGVEFIHMNHSIADTVSLAITTPVGVVVHTGDFKIDTTPISGSMADLARLGEIARQGVTLLLSDSTNAERPGSTMSERKVGESFESLFKNCDNRIIVATFASNVHRIQQIIDAAARHNRKVAISGRSMENILNVALILGYIKVPPDTLVDIGAISKYPHHKVCIITTGSQGEPMSALYRMAFSNHKQIVISPGDRVIISATPIPGNEKTVYRLVNELFKKGADVVYERLAEVHVSGHACQEELKLMLALTKPKYFMPVHGEYRHLRAHAALGAQVGVPTENIFMSEIGRILELSGDGKARLGGTVQSGRVFVDGLGVGDVGAVVLRDRKLLSQDGLIVVVVTFDSEKKAIAAGPDIVSRGFIYVKEAEDIMEELKDVTTKTINGCLADGINDWSTIKSSVKNRASDFLYEKTKRSPMILPVLMEV